MIDSQDNQDARALAMVQASGLVRLLERALTIVIAAWRDSAARRLLPRRLDLQVAGAVIAIASVTAIVLQRLATRPGPLTWIVPALFLIIGLCLIGLTRLTPRRRPWPPRPKAS